MSELRFARWRCNIPVFQQNFRDDTHWNITIFWKSKRVLRRDEKHKNDVLNTRFWGDFAQITQIWTAKFCVHINKIRSSLSIDPNLTYVVAWLASMFEYQNSENVVIATSCTDAIKHYSKIHEYYMYSQTIICRIIQKYHEIFSYYLHKWSRFSFLESKW